MVGGMPCMATTIPGVCEGEPDPNHPEWGPVAWWSVSDGTEKCNCPYTLANKCYGKYDDPNFCPKVVCSGTTIKKNGRCDSVTGNCVYDEGYCEFGCNADGTDCALEKPVKPKQTYQKGDGICSITLGERCDNSPQDCICIGGKSCQPNASDADDAGCARDVKSKCGDEYHYCDTAAGENCATCSFDCKCDAGYVCDPTSANANYMGCVRVEEKKEDNAMVCGGKVCKMFCLKDYRYDIKTGQWVPADYSMIPVRCSEGVQCTYAPAMYCKTGCNSNTGKCLPDAASADGRIEDGSSEITTLQLVSHAKHCVEDYISTIQIKNTGAPTEEEKGIVTVVPLQIAAEIQEGADYGTVSHIHPDLRDFYIKNTLKGGPIDIWIYNQHSNVIYDIYDDHEIVTVLVGEVVVTDSKTKQQFSLTIGKQLTHELGQEIQPNMQQNIDDVDLSRMEDNSTPPEGSVSANGGVCKIGLFMILLLISLYIIKGRVD